MLLELVGDVELYGDLSRLTVFEVLRARNQRQIRYRRAAQREFAGARILDLRAVVARCLHPRQSSSLWHGRLSSLRRCRRAPHSRMTGSVTPSAKWLSRRTFGQASYSPTGSHRRSERLVEQQLVAGLAGRVRTLDADGVVLGDVATVLDRRFAFQVVAADRIVGDIDFDAFQLAHEPFAVRAEWRPDRDRRRRIRARG